MKRLNTRASKAAVELHKTLNDKDWHDQTTNEHPEELKQVWTWMKEQPNITARDVVLRLAKYPFVTVTKTENGRLKALGKELLAPEERYRRAGIEIVEFAWVSSKL